MGAVLPKSLQGSAARHCSCLWAGLALELLMPHGSRTGAEEHAGCSDSQAEERSQLVAQHGINKPLQHWWPAALPAAACVCLPLRLCLDLPDCLQLDWETIALHGRRWQLDSCTGADSCLCQAAQSAHGVLWAVDDHMPTKATTESTRASGKSTLSVLTAFAARDQIAVLRRQAWRFDRCVHFTIQQQNLWLIARTTQLSDTC